jgi:hypothetical protein
MRNYIEKFECFYDDEVSYSIEVNRTTSEAYNNALLQKLFRNILTKLDRGEY